MTSSSSSVSVRDAASTVGSLIACRRSRRLSNWFCYRTSSLQRKEGLPERSTRTGAFLARSPLAPPLPSPRRRLPSVAPPSQHVPRHRARHVQQSPRRVIPPQTERSRGRKRGPRDGRRLRPRPRHRSRLGRVRRDFPPSSSGNSSHIGSTFALASASMIFSWRRSPRGSS